MKNILKQTQKAESIAFTNFYDLSKGQQVYFIVYFFLIFAFIINFLFFNYQKDGYKCLLLRFLIKSVNYYCSENHLKALLYLSFPNLIPQFVRFFLHFRNLRIIWYSSYLFTIFLAIFYQ